MRIALITILLLCLAGSPALAGELTFGPKAGIILTKVSGEPIEIEEDFDWKIEGRTGMIGGVFLNYAFNQNISLHPEILFAMRGYKATWHEDELDASIDLTAKMNYIEIPILAKFNVTMESPVVPCFYLGPSIGFNISSKVEGDYSIFEETGSVSADMDDVISKVDFGLVFGLGLEYEVGAGLLILDIRYNLGLSKIYKEGEITWKLEDNPDYVEDAEERDSKNTGLVFMLGYAF